MGKNTRGRIQDSRFNARGSLGEKTIFSIIILSFLSVFAFSSSFFNSHALAAETVGKFTYVEGNVDVLREGAFPAKPVAVKDTVMLKDIVRTKSASKAEITLRDNTVLRIAQRSRIDISEYFTGDTGKGVVKLSRGQVQAIVDKSAAKRIAAAPGANTFEVHTPNAVAGVRGTDFFVSYDNNTTTILLKEGSVCAYNINSPTSAVCLPPNYIVTITGVNLPGQPRKATERDFKKFSKEAGPSAKGASAERFGAEGLADLGSLASLGQAPLLTTNLPSYITDVPSSITDIPLTRPISEIIPGTVQPVIPAFEVGRTNLSGTVVAGQNGSFDRVSVSMNDVVFLAPSTGQRPTVWATNAVSGQYDFTHGFITPGNITNPDNMITLTNGNRITAEFQFNNWNITNNTWSAGINNGSGTLSGGSFTGAINFNGGASGTHTGGNSGSLSGTGSGTVR